MRKSTHTAHYRILRQFLCTLRQDAGLSQRALAERLELPHTWVAKVESGERRIDIVEFAWVCEACGADSARAIARLLSTFPRSRARVGAGNLRGGS
jgi:transcriptional regulator with XRE-family HTH domain